MSLKRDVRRIEKQILQELKYSEKWMIQRKKFLVKLAWVAGIIIVLLIISKLYL